MGKITTLFIILIFQASLISLISLLPFLAITSFDTFSVGESGGGEISVGGDFQDPPSGEVDEEDEDTSEDFGDGGASGGSTTLILVGDFELSETFFSFEIKKGENYKKVITITNIGNKNLIIDVSVSLSKKFIFIDQENFTLKIGESKKINFDIFLPEKEETKVYTGTITFNSSDTKKIINFILDVKDKLPLFDIKTTVLGKYVFPGGNVKADLVVLNLGDLKNIDVELEYFISGFDNKTYSLKKESVAINDSFKKKIFLETPKDVEIGSYLFHSKVSYENITANSYDTFFIERASQIIWIIILLVNVFLIISMGLLIILLSNRGKTPVPNLNTYSSQKEISDSNYSDWYTLLINKVTIRIKFISIETTI